MVDYRDFWRAEGYKHITPPGERFPEVNLKEVLTSVCPAPVLDLGCGDGRLAAFFDPSQYLGVDVCTESLREASRGLPEYMFSEELPDPKLFKCVLAHTVLLHVPDDSIQEIVDYMKQFPVVVVSEILGTKYRRDGNPPVYNRDLQDYEQLFGSKARVHKVAYPRYKTDLEVLVWTSKPASSSNQKSTRRTT